MGNKTAVKRRRVRQIILCRTEGGGALVSQRVLVAASSTLRRQASQVLRAVCFCILLRQTANTEEDYISKLKNVSKLDFQLKLKENKEDFNNKVTEAKDRRMDFIYKQR